MVDWIQVGSQYVGLRDQINDKFSSTCSTRTYDENTLHLTLMCFVCLAAKENFNTKRSINDQQFFHDSLFRAKAIAMPLLLNCIHISGVHGCRN